MFQEEKPKKQNKKQLKLHFYRKIWEFPSACVAVNIIAVLQKINKQKKPTVKFNVNKLPSGPLDTFRLIKLNLQSGAPKVWPPVSSVSAESLVLCEGVSWWGPEEECSAADYWLCKSKCFV